MNDQPDMYCLGCSYPLVSIQSDKCPECGRRFDRERPETFATSRPGSIRRYTAIVFGGSFAIGGFTACVLNVLSFTRASDEAVLSATGILLLLLLACSAACVRYWLSLLAAAVGLSWGFLIIFSVIIGVQKIWWPTFLPGLVVVPVGAFVLTIPIWVVRNVLRKKTA